MLRLRSRSLSPRALMVAAAFIVAGVSAPGARTASVLPAPWASTDIGNVGLAGSTALSDGVFTVKGAGADIWGSVDAFHFASQPMNGNGQIISRVVAVQNTHTYAKAGVMLRGALSAGSAHVILDVKPGGGIEFMKRATNGGTTAFIAGASVAAPVWVRLVKTDNTVVASWSSNGATWTEVGRTTIALPTLVYAGLAVTSHTTSALNTSTFDNVTVTPEVPNRPPTVAITTPVDGATFTAPASIAISATAADDDGAITTVEFRAGSTSLGVDTTSPYEWLWDQVPAGTYAISAVATDSVGARTESGLITLTVAAKSTVPPPAAPSTALPADGTTGLDPSTALNWIASQNATHYDVALGTAPIPPVVSLNQTATYYQPATALAYGTTYYWQVIAKNAGGSAASAIRSFTTKNAPSSSPQSSVALRRLRLMTWNVNAGRNAAGISDVDAQVSLIARSGAHVVTLQDVTIEPGADLSALYQEKLQIATGRQWAAVWAEEPASSATTPRGNLVLSVLPVVTTDVVTLDGATFDPTNTDAQRSAARVSVLVNNVTVTIAGTALAIDANTRQAQVRQLLSWIKAAPPPRLIGGSMNMQSGEAGYNDMAAAFADIWSALVKTPDRGLTTQAFAGTAAPARVDSWWQELNGAQSSATEVWVVKTTRSTHHAVIAEVAIQ
jgi:endonuclease/exonuclease/phosphatase family metal-dependent hydrolase